MGKRGPVRSVKEVKEVGPLLCTMDGVAGVRAGVRGGVAETSVD